MAVRRLFLLLLFPVVLFATPKVVVYYNVNPNFRAMDVGNFNGGMPPWEIDWTGVTHIVVSLNYGNLSATAPYWTQMSGNDSIEFEFGAISSGASEPYTHYLDSTVVIAHRLGIKVLVCVCALAEGETQLATIGADSTKTDAFADIVTQYCARKGLDGVEFNDEWSGITSANMFRVIRRVRYFANLNIGAGALVSTAANRMEGDFYPAGCDSYIDWYDPQFYGLGGFWCGDHNRNEYLSVPPIYRGYTHDEINSYSLATSRDASPPNNNGGMDAWIAAGHSASKMVVGQAMEAQSFDTGDTLLGDAGWNQVFGNWVEADWFLTHGGTEYWDNTRKGSYISGTATASCPMSWMDNVTTGEKFVVQRLSLQSADTLAKWIKDGGYGGVMLYDIHHGRDPNSENIANHADRIPLMKRIVTALGSSSQSPSRKVILRRK